MKKENTILVKRLILKGLDLKLKHLLKTLFLLTLLFCSINSTYSNPANFRGDFNSWGCNALTNRGIVLATTIQENTTSTGRNFKFDDNCSWGTSWGSNSTVTKNTKFTMSSGGGNSLYASTNSNYYTFIIQNSTGSLSSSILETTFNPSNVMSLPTLSPATIYANQNATLGITLTNSLRTGEYLYVRYTTNGWSTSSIVALTTGTNPYTCILSGLPSGTNVSYYFFTSNQSSIATPADADYFTLSYLNNTGSNYSYTVQTPTAPTVGSPTVTSATNNSATLGATITNNGGNSITDYGTVWKTTTGVTATDNKLSAGITDPGNVAFSHSRTSLSAQTLYYYKGYATNSTGTGLSSESSFYTLSASPTGQASGLSTSTPTSSSLNLGLSTAATYPSSGATKSGYLLLYNAGSAPTMQSSPNGLAPASAKASGTIVAITDVTAPTAPTFPSSVTGLAAGTTYYFLLVPYTWDGINAATYNYLTGSAASATGTTLATIGTTVAATSVTVSGASTGGQTIASAVSITAKGVAYSTAATSTTPTISNSYTSDGTGTTNFTSTLSSLSYQTQYYVRAYATNSAGTAYAPAINFYTLSNPPTTAATNFSALAASSGTQIDLSWTAASFPVSGATSSGYIILSRVDGTNPASTGVVNATAPGSLSLASGTTLLATITSGSTTTYAHSTSAGRFNYIIIPFTWDGTNASTYNYYTTSAPTTSIVIPKYFLSGSFSTPNTWTETSATAMTALAGKSTTSYIHSSTANAAAIEYFKFFSDNSGSGYYYGPATADSTASLDKKFRLANGRTNGKAYGISGTNGNLYVFKTIGSTTANPNAAVFDIGANGTVRTVSAVSVPSNVPGGSAATITATISGAFSGSQIPYLRYSTSSNFSTSTVVAMTGSGTSYTASIPAGTNVAGTAVYYYVFTSGSGGTSPASDGSDADLFSININDNSVANYTYTPTTAPALAAGTLADFGSTNCINGTYGSNSFTITGTNLTTANVTVGSLSGFTFSTSAGGTYTSSLSLSQSGGSYSQAIYVKFNPTLVQSYNGNITIAGGGAASSINVSATGSGINTAATVTTPSSTAISSTGATLGGNLTVVGCTNVTEQGIYYSTSTGFIDGAGTKVSTTGLNVSTTGTFTQAVTGLTANTVYYFKAFCTSASGTAYSIQGTFTTLNDISSADFRSAAAGPANWNTAASWQYNSTGSTWITATQTPGSTNNVSIQSGHTITLDVSPTIGSGKTLTVAGSLTAGTNTVSGLGNFAMTGTLNTANASGISGTILTSGTNTFTSGTINFNAGGAQNFGASTFGLTAMDITLSVTSTNVTLNGAASVKSVSIASVTTLDVSSSNYGLTIAAGGTLANSGTFTAQNGTVTFAGNGTLSGSNSLSLYDVSFTTGSTLNIATSVNSSRVFTFASNATYSLNFTNNATFTAAGISSTGTNTLNLLNGGSSASSKFISSSNLTITTGTSLSLGTSALPLQVNGNVSLTGTGSLALSSNPGGDIFLTGNWSRSTGTFTPNSRAVTFNGSTSQTMQNTNAGSLSFDYLAINNSGANVQMLSDVGINNNLQLFTGTLDLNQKTLTINNSSSIELGIGSGATTESIISSTATGTIVIPTTKTVTVAKFNGVGTPSFSIGNNVKLSVTGTFNPGSGLTTFASGSTVQINSGGSVSTNSPTYSAGSLLIYNLGNSSSSKFNQSYEWPSSSGPSAVKLQNTSWVQLTSSCSLTGDLTITSGALQSSGAHLLTMNGTTQTITVSNGSGGAIYGTDNGTGNDLSLLISSGSTTTLTGDATTNGDDEKKFVNITVNTGGKLALSRGILCKYGTFSVAGTLQINANGYVQATNGNPAVYSSGNLIYNNGGSYTTTDKEWPTTGYPTNVTIQNTGTVVTLNNSKTIAGDLDISAGTLDLATFTANRATAGGTLTVAGTLKLGENTGGQTGSNFPSNFSTINLTSGTVNYSKLIGGQTIYPTTYTNLTLSNTSGVQTMGSTVVVNGTMTMPTGTGTVAVGSNTVTLSGPYVSGTVNNITSTSGSNLTFNFTGAGPFTLPAISAVNNLTVNTSGQTYTLSSSPTVSGTLTVNSGSVLDAGSNVISGTGAFALQSGSTLKVAHTSGVDGVVTVSGTKTFDAAANYEFNGSGAQVTGSLLPSTVNNLTINNAAGVSLSGNTTVSGTMALNNGACSIGANTLTIDGPISSTSGTLTGGTTSNITVAGAGASTTLPAVSGGLGTLTLSRSNGTVIGSDIAINTALNVTAGTVTSTAAKISLASTSKASISSGATLNISNIEFNKTESANSEFDNRGTVSIGSSNKIRVKVAFPDAGTRWHFVSFPFAISAIYKSDGTTTAVYNTDYGMAYYDATKRANRQIPAWADVNEMPVAGKGYIFWSNADLYFETAANPSLSSFTTTASPTLTYTTATGGLTSNFGWNLIAHPITANATGSLSLGQFYYGYNYLNDSYQVSTGSQTNQKTFDSYFIKTASAANLAFSTTVPGAIRALNTLNEDKLQLNLAGATSNYTTQIRVIPESTPNYDELYDAPFNAAMLPETPEIYSLISGAKYAINSVPEQTTVPIGVRVPAVGNYTLSWNAQLNNLPVMLIDNIANTSTDVTAVSSYSFNTLVAGEINNRFSISVAQRITTGINMISNENGLKIYAQGSKIKVEGLVEPTVLKLYDVLGKTVRTKTLSNLQSELYIQTGIYILELSNTKFNYTTKLICK